MNVIRRQCLTRASLHLIRKFRHGNLAKVGKMENDMVLHDSSEKERKSFVFRWRSIKARNNKVIEEALIFSSINNVVNHFFFLPLLFKCTLIFLGAVFFIFPFAVLEIALLLAELGGGAKPIEPI